jgi:hypothetical protein
VTDDRGGAIPAHNVAALVTVPISVGTGGLHAVQKTVITIDAAAASPIQDRILWSPTFDPFKPELSHATGVS